MHAAVLHMIGTAALLTIAEELERLRAMEGNYQSYADRIADRRREPLGSRSLCW